jgi:hypothetical protein
LIWTLKPNAGALLAVTFATIMGNKNAYYIQLQNSKWHDAVESLEIRVKLFLSSWSQVH